MTHTTKIVEKKKLGDGQVAVLIRCCEDPATDSWHTLSFTKSTTVEDVTAWVAGRHQHVQDTHVTAQAIDAHLDTIG